MKRSITRVISLLLVAALLWGFAVPVQASHDHSDTTQNLEFQEVDSIASLGKQGLAQGQEADEPRFSDTDVVRVSIILERRSTIQAGFSTKDITSNETAMSYRDSLKEAQAGVTAKIEAATSGKLDVVWNLTLAANIISANVAYGKIEDILNVPGVKDVVVETRYTPCVASVDTADPNMSTSAEMIGSNTAWAAGYTGAGRRIAIIDTGIDTEHQSFTSSGLNYALAYQAGLEGKSVAAYMQELNLLDANEIAAVLDQLNIQADADKLYLNAKLPFAYNYIDGDYDVIHNNDTAGEHGSHVAGIAAANAYIPNSDGTFSNALESVKVQGVAPDAQIITMKVFGKGGGAYDSDYMAAIEDAIILGADSINLSLGSGSPGFSRNSTAAYQAIMENLTESDTVVTISAGNSYGWVDNVANGVPYLYSDDVSLDTVGSPSSFVNSLSVASVDNSGATGEFLKVGDGMVFYNQTSYSNQPIRTLAGEQQYILIDGFGTDEDFAAIQDVLAGKIAVCSRGSTSFYQKAEAAVNYGAIATVIYNNQAGVINMDLSSYTKNAPVISVTQADGAVLKANAVPVLGEDGTILYYAGTLTVSSGIGSANYDLDYYTMSGFSSYGVPGSLLLKPEITAPGGNIYSVNGSHKDTASGPVLGGSDQYENMSGTSMAAPQVAGMAAVVAQYIRENRLSEKTGLSTRQLATSLLMSTAEPLFEEESGGNYWSILKQGSGLANVGSAVSAESYILMGEDATASYADGKVKAELGDDPQRTGSYSFSFSIHNLADQSLDYTLAADFFTQNWFSYNDNRYLDTGTAILPASVIYTVDGAPFIPVSRVECDLDQDGDTDADDAQIILDYVASQTGAISGTADVDGDGAITTYDAYLLLDSMETRQITVPANGSVKISVTVNIPEETKEYLNTYYGSGAYVEGYVFIQPVVTPEGSVPVTHSIPVLGFYGSWSDGSMYDKVSYTDALYGDKTAPYTGVVETNNLIIRYAGDSTNYYQLGNPYMLEESGYPEGRAAINTNDTLYQYKLSLIRNAAAITYVITNEDNEVLDIGPVANQFTGAYYDVDNSTWRNAAATCTMNKKVSALGVKEGDVINVSSVAVPEYYENGAALTADDVKALVESGKLGPGAFLTTTLTVDNTAPEVTGITKDLLTCNLTITASDNNYIASVQVLSTNGTLYAQALPAATKKGQVTTTTVELSEVTIGPKCLVAVADYAGNETVYEVEYGGEPEDYTGRMFGFTSSSIRGSGQRWVEIDPEHVYYYNATVHEGITNVASTNLEVYAAEYVDGYVFFATDTGFYTARQGEWADYQKVSGFPEGVTAVRDMAFNYSNQTMYFLDSDNTVYSLNLTTGTAEKVATVSVTNPKSAASTYKALTAMTIDDDGNFYAVNYGSNGYVYLYTWTLHDVVDGAISDLTPVNNTADGGLHTSGLYSQNFQSLAWDHDRDILYFGAGYAVKSSSSVDNELWIIDVETGKAGRASNYAGGYDSAYAGRFQAHVVGLYIVPSSSQAIVPTDRATGIELSKTELNMLRGCTVTLTADVYPWTLTDGTVTWTTSDASVATVDNGAVSGVGVGTATITVTTRIEPHLSATCEVTVEQLPNISFTGLVYGADGAPVWADFHTDAPAGYTVLAGGGNYLAGSLLDDVIYVHDGSTIFGIDADGFISTSYGSIDSSWIWSDAAPAPATEEGLFGRIVGLCNNGTMLEMLNPATGALNYWNMSSYFSSDPMAVLAYVGSGTYDYGSYADCPAHFYYMMTEGGELYSFVIFTYTKGSSYSVTRLDLGNTGLNLTNVSAVTGGAHASMVYDQETGYLLVSAHTEGETANLYAVDPETYQVANLGNLGDQVYPLVALYQYERVTDLTLKLSKAAASIYKNDTLQLSAKVKPGTFTGGVTWSSSDTTVATVDANGVVTGIGDGTAVITATTVDQNAAGETLSASCVVTVVGLVEVSATVNAQIITDEGPEWVTIHTGDLSTVTVNGKANIAISGGGVHNGKIYGTNSDFFNTCNIYRIDPSSGYTETQGGRSPANNAIHDMTTAPAMSFTATNKSGENVTLSAFDCPIYIAHGQGLYMLTDYEAGRLTGWSNLNFYYSDLAAFTYMNDGTYTDAFGVKHDMHVYLALGADGTLYRFMLYPTYDANTDTVGYTLSRSAYGNIGMEFKDYTALSMTYVEISRTEYGLVIADSSDGASLYYVSLAANELSCGKIGNVRGASTISSLYTTAELSGHATAFDTNFRVGTDEISSSDVSVALPLEEPLAAVSTNLAGSANVNEIAGSTNAISGKWVRMERAASVQEHNVSVADGTVALTLTEDADVNNGLIQITYDPKVLTYDSVSTMIVNYAVNVDAVNGTIIFDYATAKAIAAGNPLATIHFTYTAGSINTTVQIETLERNARLDIPDEHVELAITYEVGGDHNYVVTDSKDPTCTEEGYKIFTCSKCGDSYQEILESLGHDWNGWMIVKAAICTEDGSENRSCSRCNATETRIIPAIGHSFTKTVVVPTCTAEGYDQYVCNACGISYRDNIIPATGHGYVVAVTAPTCVDRGYTTYTCSACGDTYVTEYVDASGHNWSEWATTKQPGCDMPGEKTRICSVCQATETEIILPTGHTYVSTVIEPTCTVSGYTKHTCQLCGLSYATDVTNPLDHNWNAWTVTVESSCITEGEETRTCARCHETEIRAVAAKGHTYEEALISPTCTEVGYTKHICSVCGESYLTDIVSATGHTMGAWTVSKAAACIDDGVEIRTCENCGTAETRTIPATGHSWSDWTVVKAPTCTAAGETIRTCANCEESETHTVPANSENCPSKAFRDLNTGHWYHEGVDYVLYTGLMKGVSATEFQPHGNLTRGQIVTILYRLAGSPKVTTATPFTDVVANSYYSDAVAWAYENKIVRGVTETVFGPGRPVTREQLVTFIYRYAESDGVSLNTTSDLSQYPDAGAVSAYAIVPMSWAVKNGIVNGIDGKLSPKGTASRVQIAVILLRYGKACG